jgi:hypothetical protein
MASPCVALVSRDPRARLELAAAFDSAPLEWRVELHESPPPAADAVVLGADVEAGPAGAIAFDPRDPAGALDAVTRRLRRGAPGVVAVTSATGGAGVTSVALHLAAAARSPACLVDLAGGAAARLGLEGSGPGAAAPVPVPGGFRLLAPSPGGDADAAAAFLEEAAAPFASVVVDVAPGPLLTTVLARCRAAVLVMTPALPAARRSRALLDAAGSVPWAVVTNRLGPGGETTRSELEGALGRRIALELPCCPALRDAEDDGGLLLSGWTRWRRAVDRLAAAVGQRA